MRRVAACAAVLVLVLAACRGQQRPATTSPAPGMRLVKAGTLTVGVAVREPFAFQENGDWKGFDVEVAREIAKEAGLKTEIVKAERDALKQLEDRKVDVVASVPTTGKRRAGTRVTDPYYNYKVQ